MYSMLGSLTWMVCCNSCELTTYRASWDCSSTDPVMDRKWDVACGCWENQWAGEAGPVGSPEDLTLVSNGCGKFCISLNCDKS